MHKLVTIYTHNQLSYHIKLHIPRYSLRVTTFNMEPKNKITTGKDEEAGKRKRKTPFHYIGKRSAMETVPTVQNKMYCLNGEN